MSDHFKDSAAITSIEHTQTLEVRFKSGNTYRFFGVPHGVYESFKASDSQGAFFNSDIKDKYSFEKVI